jgi:polyvinyl alcohol dehydrogenase (cytochrome)
MKQHNIGERCRRSRSFVLLLVAGLATLVGLWSPVTAQAGISGGGGGNPADWNGWQHDLLGTRFNPAEYRINPATVGNLKLKWAYVLPTADDAMSSQPAVVGKTLYVGGHDGRLYALNRTTGATRWIFDTSTVTGSSSTANPLRDGPVVAGDKVIFGDYRGNLYAVNKNSGTLVWSQRLSTHPSASLTGSPIVYGGRVYVGVASSEEQVAANPSYPCCTFRGQLDAVDLSTGAVDWRYYTVPPATGTGTTTSGVDEYAPAGAAVWSSPVVDPFTKTVVFATGNNYSGTVGDSDSVIAVDAVTGTPRWKRQMTHPDTWTVGCLVPTTTPHCPGLSDGSDLDFDFGATPNIFHVRGKTLVGVGQKTGIYDAFDINTGRTIWQRQLSVSRPNGGESGIQWGSSYDGRHLYVATWQAAPGTLFALDPATGAIVWSSPNPSDGCATGGAVTYPQNCNLSLIAAVSSTPGLVYEGSADGKMRIYRSSNGSIVWQYDTVRQFAGVNGETGSGGSVSGNSGAVISHGMLYVDSGYYSFYGIPGHVLLAFGL